MEMVLSLQEARKQNLLQHLIRRCDDLMLSVRTCNVLQNHGVEFIWQLVEQNSETISAPLIKGGWKNLGAKSFNEIRKILMEIGLQLNTRLTDALKRELGAPIKDDDPHEDVEPLTGPTTMPDHVISLEDLQQKLDVTNTAIENTECKILEAQTELTKHEDRKRALEFSIKHFNTIALALS